MLTPGNCDNKDGFVAGGVGTFLDSLQLKSTQTCGSINNKCYWQFQISKRDGGDNYKVYPQTADSPSQNYFAGASPPYTTVKHIHAEKDKMCRNGGIIGINAAVNDTRIYLSKLYNATTAQWDRVDTVVDDNQIAIFDADRPFEGPHDTAFALITNPDFVDIQGRHYVEVSLKVAIGGAAYDLDYSYAASVMQNAAPFSWTFDNGKSAGICVMDGLFYEADTSGLRYAYNEAFVNFHIAPNGSEGAGVVPYLPLQWFNAASVGPADAMSYFSQIWFAHFQSQGGGPPPLDKEHNYIHVIGASSADRFAGLSLSSHDWTFVMEQSIETFCAGQAGNCSRAVSAHELAHHLGTNACTDLPNCLPPPPDTLGQHDYRGWWQFGGAGCPSLNPCLMDPNAGNPLDGINRFCIEDLLLGDPNCPAPVPPDTRDGAIRTTPDPQ
jgi:hypothetical protein